MKQELMFRELAWQVAGRLRKRFPDVTVEICQSKYAPGLNVEIISEAFRPLLPEQRYHHMRHAIGEEGLPAELEKAVFVELAPGETLSELEDKMLEGRSLSDEDVEELLRQTGFLEALAVKLGCSKGLADAPQGCREDFRYSQEVLREAEVGHTEALEVLEYLMERGAFCDCEIMMNLG